MAYHRLTNNAPIFQATTRHENNTIHACLKKKFVYRDCLPKHNLCEVHKKIISLTEKGKEQLIRRELIKILCELVRYVAYGRIVLKQKCHAHIFSEGKIQANVQENLRERKSRKHFTHIFS